MESNPLRGLFGVSSPRPVEQRVAPQPTEPTENENGCFEIPSGMIEKLLANPFLGPVYNFPLFSACKIALMLMTHKCRGSIIVLSISKSVEPNEEQKEMTSSFQ